jgi:hypothetical protein
MLNLPFLVNKTILKKTKSNRIEIYFVEEPQYPKPATVLLGVDCILFDNLHKDGKCV